MSIRLLEGMMREMQMVSDTSSGGSWSAPWRRRLAGPAMALQAREGTLLGSAAGAAVRIGAIEGEAEVRSRLLELGFTPGCEVTVLAHGPLGGPLAVSCRGAILALRRSEAACIRVA